MIVRRGQMVFVAISAMLLAACLYVTGHWFESWLVGNVAPVVALVVGGVWIVRSVGAYHELEAHQLVQYNEVLAILVRRKMRSGGMLQCGQSVLYRSRGRRVRRSPWPRLWVVPVAGVRSIPIGSQWHVDAFVVWPVPFLGGVRHRRGVRVCIQRQGYNKFSFYPDPLRRSEWYLPRDLSSKGKAELAADMYALICGLRAATHHDAIGRREQFWLNG